MHSFQSVWSSDDQELPDESVDAIQMSEETKARVRVVDGGANDDRGEIQTRMNVLKNS